ncbi:uncharacterized protein EI90DRAFT_3058587, partial [Cantharellus anzutake]|uniref:uncharacterized protein n=1 Tax=Cantharellus anzutake TaxID=1750568 RepID=UPI001907FD27
MSRNASSVTTEERNYDELVGQIRCNCRLEAVLRTTGPGKKNTGRNFFACPKYSTDPSNCRFFKWADELSGPGVPTTQIPKTPLRPNPKSNLGSPALTTSVMRGSGMTPASSAPRTPQSKPRDTGASQRRLALIRGAQYMKLLDLTFV